MKKIASLIDFLAASAVFAQPLTVGIMPNAANTSLGGTYVTTAPWSVIDVAHPAASNGTVNRASVMWSFACSGAFKLAFLRKGSNPTSFTVTAVRGPFDATAGRVDVSLSPPVSVTTGDLIALVQLQPEPHAEAPLTNSSPEGNPPSG